MNIHAKTRLMSAKKGELEKKVKAGMNGSSFESMLDTVDTLIAEYDPGKDSFYKSKEDVIAALRTLAPALKKGVDAMRKALKGSGWQLAENEINEFCYKMTEDIGAFVGHVLIRLNCDESVANAFGYKAGDLLMRKL